jgi:hypothetical protein
MLSCRACDVMLGPLHHTMKLQLGVMKAYMTCMAYVNLSAPRKLYKQLHLWTRRTWRCLLTKKCKHVMWGAMPPPTRAHPLKLGGR